MVFRMFTAVALVMVALFSAPAAEAHTYGAIGAGLSHGFAHPLGGLDHLLTLIAVGLWAARTEGRTVWLAPLIFIFMVAVGGMVGMLGVSVPLVETGILGSLIFFGGLVAYGTRLSMTMVVLFVGAFAFLHGHAHGTEMPQAASAGGYALGFMVASALVLLSGLGLGRLLIYRRNVVLYRLSGGAIAAIGGVLLLG